MNGTKWDDLAARVATGAVLAAVGVWAVFAGGIVFVAVCLVAGAAMIWELTRLTGPDANRRQLGAAFLAVLGLLSFAFAPGFMALIPMGCALVLGAWGLPADRARIMAFYGSLVFMGLIGMMVLRVEGARPVIWLVGIVVASDTGGYFGGRLIGGPKFWPRVSPKKTWSGTVAGWMLAALVGLVLGPKTGSPVAVMAISVLFAFAAQMGDVAESAVKRHLGVKDASNLLPGHGGFLDRFDAMLATFALALLLSFPAPAIVGFG